MTAATGPTTTALAIGGTQSGAAKTTPAARENDEFLELCAPPTAPSCLETRGGIEAHSAAVARVLCGAATASRASQISMPTARQAFASSQHDAEVDPLHASCDADFLQDELDGALRDRGAIAESLAAYACRASTCRRRTRRRTFK